MINDALGKEPEWQPWVPNPAFAVAPMAKDNKIVVRRRDGGVATDFARNIRWAHTGDADDIVAYRAANGHVLTPPKEGDNEPVKVEVRTEKAPHATVTVRTAEPGRDVDATLTARGHDYGDFRTQAVIVQRLKNVMRTTPGWDNLTPAMQEALEMTQHKISRILNGNPNKKDSWHDIVGYVKLVDDTLTQ